jgi:hypothetical protein
MDCIAVEFGLPKVEDWASRLFQLDHELTPPALRVRSNDLAGGASSSSSAASASSSSSAASASFSLSERHGALRPMVLGWLATMLMYYDYLEEVCSAPSKNNSLTLLTRTSSGLAWYNYGKD